MDVEGEHGVDTLRDFEGPGLGRLYVLLITIPPGKPTMPFRRPWCQSGRTRRSNPRGLFETFLANLSAGRLDATNSIAAFSAGPPNLSWIQECP